jgi:transcriptional regulator with XRE-family HTH domain
MEPIQFGGYLKSLREKAELSMGQLARQAKISQPYISQIESGQRGIPSPEILNKLATALGVPPVALLFAAGHVKLGDLGLSDYETGFFSFMSNGNEYRGIEAWNYLQERKRERELRKIKEENEDLRYELLHILNQKEDGIPVLYNGHLLKEDDKKRALMSLEALFSDYKSFSPLNDSLTFIKHDEIDN